MTGGTGPGSYYFPVVMQLVLVFPFVFLIVGKCGMRALPILFLLNLGFEVLQWSFGMSGAMYRLLVFRYVFMIGVGAYVGVHGDAIGNGVLGACLVAGAAYAALVNYTGYEPRIVVHWTSTSLFYGLYVMPAFCLFLRRCRSWRNGLLELTGRASWHIFLTQMVYYSCPVVYRIVDVNVLRLCFNIFICIFIGILFYTFENYIMHKSIL